MTRKARRNFHEQIKNYGQEKITKHNQRIAEETTATKQIRLDKFRKSAILYTELSYGELREIAKEKKIKNYWKKTKEVLIEELSKIK